MAWAHSQSPINSNRMPGCARRAKDPTQAAPVANSANQKKRMEVGAPALIAFGGVMFLSRTAIHVYHRSARKHIILQVILSIVFYATLAARGGADCQDQPANRSLRGQTSYTSDAANSYSLCGSSMMHGCRRFIRPGSGMCISRDSLRSYGCGTRQRYP